MGFKIDAWTSFFQRLLLWRDCCGSAEGIAISQVRRELSSLLHGSGKGKNDPERERWGERKKRNKIDGREPSSRKVMNEEVVSLRFSKKIFLSERNREQSRAPFFSSPKLRFQTKQRAAMLCSKLSAPQVSAGPRRGGGRSGRRSNLPSSCSSSTRSKSKATTAFVVAASSTSGALRDVVRVDQLMPCDASVFS